MTKIDIKFSIIKIKLFLIIALLGFSNSYANDVLDRELLDCVLKKDSLCVQQKLNSGASPDYKINANGVTTLILTILPQHYDRNIISLLIDKSNNPDLSDINGTTALMIAAEHARLFVVKKLLNNPNKPADPKLIRKDGRSALTFAMQTKHTSSVAAVKNASDKIVLELLQKGTKPDIDQLRIFYNLELFLDQYTSKSSEFKNKLKASEGHCAGLARVWLYSKWISENTLANGF